MPPCQAQEADQEAHAAASARPTVPGRTELVDVIWPLGGSTVLAQKGPELDPIDRIQEDDMFGWFNGHEGDNSLQVQITTEPPQKREHLTSPMVSAFTIILA